MVRPVPMIFFVFLTLNCYAYQRAWNADHEHYRIPQDVMVDVVNNLALKLLTTHNEGNEDNIALSPYGALSVLVALEEGVQGSAAKEIRRAANLPSQLSVIRVGLRDIHRHLKSYFIPEEGFLSGLSLSYDNVTLNREYEDILRFYGFDINSFNNALYPEVFTTAKSTDQTETTVTTTESSTSTTKIPTTTLQMTTEVTTQEGSEAKEETSTSVMTSTITAINTASVTELTTNSDNILNDGMTTPQQVPTTETESTEATEVSTIPEDTTAGDVETTTININTVTMKSETTLTDIISTTEIPNLQTTTTTSTTSATTDTSVAETTSVTTTESNRDTNFSTERVATEESLESSTTLDSTTIISTTSFPEINTIQNTDPSNDSLIRSRRSVVDYIIARYYDEHIVTQRPPPYNIEEGLYFLVSGKYRETNVNFMTYDTVLPFHYIPHLKTSALQFPLDSSKYYLLLLLPDNHRQINKLICDLGVNSSLKYVIDNLRYTHVKAIIPSFMLKGNVVLTSTLQKMGINRVFEPRQADFSPMTLDRGVYVTNIEQAITVNIKNYVDPAAVNNNISGHLRRSNPVIFNVDHPFLYFVIDSEIDVTLMAGKIVNPLNSRIRK